MWFVVVVQGRVLDVAVSVSDRLPLYWTVVRGLSTCPQLVDVTETEGPWVRAQFVEWFG